MIHHGSPPHLECSSRGDQRFSALYARIIARDLRTIEEIYQSSKEFEPDTAGVDAAGHVRDWRSAKGKRAKNQKFLLPFYETLWRVCQL